MKKILSVLFIIAFIFISIIKAHVVKAVPIGNYLELAGGYIETTISNPQAPQGFAAELWISPESISGLQTILSVKDNTTQTERYALAVNGGSLQLKYRYNISSLKIITAGYIKPGVWNHIGVTISNLFTKLYINGGLIFSTSGASGLLPIGNDMIIGGTTYKGLIDEVRISNISRDIAGNWSSGTYQNPLTSDNNTLILYHLDETRGQNTATDSSGNNQNGLLVGGDKEIHFFGVLPTPTPFALPTLKWNRVVLPTISFPGFDTPTPTTTQEENSTPYTPSFPDYHNYRITRPVYF